MKRHVFQINALNAIAMVVIIIVISMISLLLIICIGGNSHSNNNSSNTNNSNNDSGNLLSSQASDAAVGMLTELGVNHMGIKSNPTETKETKIEQNFLTHNCNKFCTNPKGNNSSSSSSSITNNNNNNNSSNINRTPVAQINEIIKNVRPRGSNCRCLDSKSLKQHLGQHERATWTSRCFGKHCCSSRRNVSNAKVVEKMRKSCRYADLKSALTPPQMRPRYRAKRFIIFDGSGVVKFVAGIAFPVILADKQRQVSVTNNFQGQYTPPPTPIYWWSFVNTTTFAARKARALPLQLDASRAFVYKAIESLLESKGLPGTVCLLKAICFVSQQPLDGSNIFHALLNAILIPAAANIDTQYLDAQTAGRYGVDCERTFEECPKYTKWLQGVKIF